MPARFRFRLLPFAVAVVLVAAGVALAQWQWQRARETALLDARMQARRLAPPLRGDVISAADVDVVEFRRAHFDGSFVRTWPIYLDNRPYDGIAGYYLLMPFKIAGSDRYVLVARGWFPRDVEDRTRMPPLATPDGVVQIEGIVRRDVGHVLQLGRTNPLRPGAILQNLDAATFARASGLKMLPFVIEQTGDARDGLVRAWPGPPISAARHRAYAFQWYALAAMAFVFFVVTGFRRGAG